MAKRIKIGDKHEIMNRNKEKKDIQIAIQNLADKSEEEALQWFRTQFKELPKQAREGLEKVIKTLWANAKILRQMGFK